ncbi:MAG: FliH/SctL family protein [Bdellovibrionales bacterium]
MRSSKSIITKEQAVGLVLEFQPQSMKREISQEAEQYFVREKTVQSGFKMSHLVASQTGIAEKEKAEIEKQVEQIALEKIKEIQEPAYKEAYAIGLEEGTKKAFEEHRQTIQEQLEKLDILLTSMGHMKRELMEQNEIYFIKTIHTMATKLAVAHIEEHKETIISVMKQAVDHAQSEENVMVKLCKEDFEFVEKFRENSKKEFDFLKKVKMEVSSDIKSGGCIVETNYGTIDATVEERINKLWSMLESKLPKETPVISSEDKT